MDVAHDLSKFGGRPVRLMGGSTDNVAFNFGLKPKDAQTEGLIKATPPLYAKFPAIQGKWDGTTTVNHWDAARLVMGDRVDDLIQMQPRGTCGGRAGSLTGDLVQCILIAAGQRAKLHRVSHAAVYYAARKFSGMLGGNWRDDNGDGVASGSVPNALASVAGYVGRDEDGDLNYYGDGSDDLACQLGCGQQPALGKKIEEMGRDNFITSWSPVNSAAELADGIAAGGVGIGSDGQGFAMTRDAEGFCRPQSTWQHYQTRASVFANRRGRKGFGYAQSWGKNTPGGPPLPGHPGNCFGVDYDVQDEIIKSGDWAVVFGFPLFDLQAGGVELKWVF